MPQAIGQLIGIGRCAILTPELNSIRDSGGNAGWECFFGEEKANADNDRAGIALAAGTNLRIVAGRVRF
jgi:hypothetical protein